MRKLGVVAMMAMTLMLAACTNSTAPPAHRTSSFIAWISTPAPPTTTTTLPLAPLCTKADLRVQFLGAGAAAGMVTDDFQLTNISKTTCRLQGQPKLSPSTTAGGHMSSVVRHGYLPLDIVPANLAPKASGYVIIGGTDNCPPIGGTSHVKPVPYKHVRVALPNGEGTFITSEMPPCVPMSVSLGVEPPVLVLPSPGSLASLDVTVDMPANVRAGHVLHYTVVLSIARQVYGPSGTEASRSVSLVPCPGYSEVLSLFIPGHVGQEHTWTYTLNCGPVGRLAPGKSARFAMELSVPTVSKVLAATFGWYLNTGSGNTFNAAAAYQGGRVYP